MRVLLFGTFDHLHPGHRFVFDAASRRGTVFIVVARDSTVEKIKRRKPDQGEADRRRAVEEAFPEAQVALGDPADFLRPVRAIAPDLILLGYDQKLPPGVAERDLPCPIERLPAFKPEEYKSSLKRAREPYN